MICETKKGRRKLRDVTLERMQLESVIVCIEIDPLEYRRLQAAHAASFHGVAGCPLEHVARDMLVKGLNDIDRENYLRQSGKTKEAARRELLSGFAGKVTEALADFTPGLASCA